MLRGVRSYLKLDALGAAASVQFEVLSPLLQCGDAVKEGVDVSVLGLDAQQELRVMHRQGFVRIFSSQGGDRYSLFSLLHLYYYQDQLLRARVKRVSPQPSDITLQHFLLVCITRMSSKQLRTTLSVGVDGRVLERKLQVEFHSAARSVLPDNFNICPDVGKVCSNFLALRSTLPLAAALV